MPTPEQILQGLTAISNEARWVAISWHAVALALGFALLLGWRPPQRVFGLVLALPLLSASIAAWAFRNPFNGTTILLVALVMVVTALRSSTKPIGPGPTWTIVSGALMTGFGLLYPHFLAAESVIDYMYAAPVGLVPCPTLSVVVGLLLISGGLGARALSSTVSIAGLFYGLFGTLRLGVMIDVVLIAGAGQLLVLAVTLGARSPTAPPTDQAV